MPAYTAAERAHLKTIAAEPTTVTTDGTQIGALSAALALWALALATYIITQAVPVLELSVAGSIGFVLVALAVLVLAAATGIVSTLPGPLYAVADYLPTHGAILALRATATDGTGLTAGVVQLAGWLVVGTLASILVTDRRRYLSAKQLRLRHDPLALAT